MIVSGDLQATLRRAYDRAKIERHEYITLEHLLLALIDDPRAADILYHVDADVESLRSELEDFLSEQVPVLPADDDEAEPQYTIGVQYVLQVAAGHVQSAGKQEVDGGHVLVALFREPESHAVFFLAEQDISRFDVVRYVSHGVSKREGLAGMLAEPDRPDHDVEDEDDDEERGAPVDPLGQFCVDLNARAAAGRLDPLIGRRHELDRTIRILARRRKNNPIFVGDAGVGKTAIAEGLAQAIVAGTVPEVLGSVTVYALDMGALIAGTKFRGEFEERLKAVVAAVSDQPDMVLFIDEIHTIIGAGAVSGGTLDASNLLKPALASGEIRCIGTTTYKEYRQVFEKDAALSRRFQKIEVDEPSEAETVQILDGLKSRYEDYHGVQYSRPSLEAAAELSARHIRDRFLPDKAIDVMDEAGAEVKLRHAGRQLKGPSRVTSRDVESVVSRMAKVPTRTVHRDDRDQLRGLDRDLKHVLFGQDEAIDQVVEAIRLSRAGLGEPDKPIGSFLFAGPTGVGKTELSKQLAAHLGIDFLRFDMSEYQEKHTVSRLVGAPPGYVGYDQGGQLSEAIIRSPHAVVLLDELEKAHEDIYQILLQVMDHATLTDASGRKADFHQAILIMTTNVGARDLSKAPVGFGSGPSQEQRGLKAVEEAFSPEFRNRLTAIVPFHPLPQAVVERIVDRMVGELEARLLPKRIKLVLTDAARTHLAQVGFDPQFGARPIRRTIEQQVSHKLSHEILFGRLHRGGTVTIDVEGGALQFRFGGTA